MPFTVTFQPRNRISGVTPTTVEMNTAAEAWAEVQMLEASDEKVEIRDPTGRTISSLELRELAKRGAN